MNQQVTWTLKQAAIFLIFKAINNSGTTVVMVTHDMDMVSYLNKRVIALEGGRVVSDQMRGAAFHEN